MSEPAQGSTMRQRTAAPVSASASAGSSGSASSPRTSTPSSPHRSETQAYPVFAGEVPWAERSFLYQWRPFRGAWFDLKRRAPFYWSDWTEAARPRNLWTVAQSVPRMYFINLMPALAYTLDMTHRTNGAYGVNETILASALAAIVFSVFSCQPLTFVGFTGLINLVNYTQYDIVVEYYGLSLIDYLRVQAWSLIWAAGFILLIAIFNICDYTRFITDFSSSAFGFYVGVVYIQKGIELLLLEFEPLPLDNATGWLSVVIAILFTVSVYFVSAVGKTSYLPFRVRTLIANFAFTAGCLIWTGFSHFPENSLRRVPIERLPITPAWFPTLQERGWWIDWYNLEARWIFVSAGFGFGIAVLFYFDHQVSSVMAQSRQYPVKRPAGFHWDFVVLAVTTLVSGFLGLPAPNGLVPQCPWHTDSLSVYKQVEDPSSRTDEESDPKATQTARKPRSHVVNSRVVEQRASHLLIGLLTLATMTRPFLVALGTMPRALFAGIFILVGWSSIDDNPVTTRTLAIFRDRAAGAPAPEDALRRRKIALFVGVQWLFFAMSFAISNTIAAIGFPIIITALIPFRSYVMPRWFSEDELAILDAPTADSDVVLASIGGGLPGQKAQPQTGAAGWDHKRPKRDDGEEKRGFAPSPDSGAKEADEKAPSSGAASTREQPGEIEAGKGQPRKSWWRGSKRNEAADSSASSTAVGSAAAAPVASQLAAAPASDATPASSAAAAPSSATPASAAPASEITMPSSTPASSAAAEGTSAQASSPPTDSALPLTGASAGLAAGAALATASSSSKGSPDSEAAARAREAAAETEAKATAAAEKERAVAAAHKAEEEERRKTQVEKEAAAAAIKKQENDAAAALKKQRKEEARREKERAKAEKEKLKAEAKREKEESKKRAREEKEATAKQEAAKVAAATAAAATVAAAAKLKADQEKAEAKAAQEEKAAAAKAEAEKQQAADKAAAQEPSSNVAESKLVSAAPSVAPSLPAKEETPTSPIVPAKDLPSKDAKADEAKPKADTAAKAGAAGGFFGALFGSRSTDEAPVTAPKSEAPVISSPIPAPKSADDKSAAPTLPPTDKTAFVWDPSAPTPVAKDAAAALRAKKEREETPGSPIVRGGKSLMMHVNTFKGEGEAVPAVQWRDDGEL